MPKRIYSGPHPEVDVPLPDGIVRVRNGEPVEVPEETAKSLDQQDCWVEPKRAAAGGKGEVDDA